ncbi:F-box protein-like protein isoform X1 [Tanacetum coccineum]
MDSNAGSSSQVSKKLNTNRLPSSVESVGSNDDLLSEILPRLPAISLSLFKLVSKRWLSLITSPDVVMRRRQIPNLDPPSGLFLFWRDPLIIKFVPLDNRIQFNTSALDTMSFIFGSEPPAHVEIMQSCNGLFLCGTWFNKLLYVCNPSINNMFKMLPQRDYMDTYVNIAFDPTKSPHYKVIQFALDQDYYYKIETYSSETGNWNDWNKWYCIGGEFSIRSIADFEYGIYWNNAIHWLSNSSGCFLHHKLVIADCPIIAIMLPPLTVDKRVPRDCKLFKSRSSLLLICREDTNSRHLHIYEMRNGYCEWSVKYIVNLDDIMTPFPDSWSMGLSVFCIVLGEKEEDSSMVINFSGKIVQYKIASKTLCILGDLGSLNNPVGCFQFIASYANV